MPTPQFTICALTFGDSLDEIQRCLRSIRAALPEGSGTQIVAEIRIGLNAVTPRVLNWVRQWSHEIATSGVPVYHYRTDENHYKYPIMRRMLREPHHVPTTYMMWFDDDSYFEDHVGEVWWARLLTALTNADVLGQIWLMPVQGQQLEWIKTQRWRNPNVPDTPPKKAKGKPAFEFCQGAWWVGRTAALLRHDWPLPEIRHNGGDSMLGELCRHQGLRMVRFVSGKQTAKDGVRINADRTGRHSKNPRRGHSEKRVGWNYVGKPLDISHQNFPYKIEAYYPPAPPTPDNIDLEIIDLPK